MYVCMYVSLCVSAHICVAWPCQHLQDKEGSEDVIGGRWNPSTAWLYDSTQAIKSTFIWKHPECLKKCWEREMKKFLGWNLNQYKVKKWQRDEEDLKLLYSLL